MGKTSFDFLASKSLQFLTLPSLSMLAIVQERFMLFETFATPLTLFAFGQLRFWNVAHEVGVLSDFHKALCREMSFFRHNNLDTSHNICVVQAILIRVQTVFESGVAGRCSDLGLGFND